MSVEVVSEMTKRAGIKADFELLSWKDAYERAQRDRDTCVFSTARLDNRKNLFKWVGPIVENRWAVFGKQGMKQKPAALGDLRYLRVGVLEGDAKATYLMDNGIASALNKVGDDALNPSKLTADKNEPGKIDVWVTGYYSAQRTAAKTNTKDVEYIFTLESSPNYLACNGPRECRQAGILNLGPEWLLSSRIRHVKPAPRQEEKNGAQQRCFDGRQPMPISIGSRNLWP
jgi:polar amino acid transport system substrate-binding protein